MGEKVEPTRENEELCAVCGDLNVMKKAWINLGLRKKDFDGIAEIAEKKGKLREEILKRLNGIYSKNN